MSAPANHAAALLVTADLAAPDAATTIADLRIALGTSRGLHLDEIDPGLGYDMSRRAFDTVRTTWQTEVTEGLTSEHMRTGYERARTYWAARRPEWMSDWPTVPEGGAS